MATPLKSLLCVLPAAGSNNSWCLRPPRVRLLIGLEAPVASDLVPATPFSRFVVPPCGMVHRQGRDITSDVVTHRP